MTPLTCTTEHLILCGVPLRPEDVSACTHDWDEAAHPPDLPRAWLYAEHAIRITFTDLILGCDVQMSFGMVVEAGALEAAGYL